MLCRTRSFGQSACGERLLTRLLLSFDAGGGGGGGGIGKLVIDSGFFASCHLFIFNFIMVAY